MSVGARTDSTALGDGAWEDELPAVDLRTLLGEMAGLKSELRASTVQAREARAQADDALSLVRQMVDRAQHREDALRRAAAEERRNGAKALIDVSDRLEAALRGLRAPAKSRWPWGLFADRNTESILDAVRQGLDLTLQGVHAKLQQGRVMRVPTVGRAFDPNRMEALRAERRGDRPDGEVLEEIVSGWHDDDAVLRTAQVVVNRRP